MAMEERCAVVRLKIGRLGAAARVGASLSMVALEAALWSPTAAAADVRPAPPAVHHPIHKAPPSHRVAPANPAPQGYIPCDITRAYHLDLMHAAGFTGANQKIAIIAAFDNPSVQADLHAFDIAFGLPDPAFQIVNMGPPNTATGTGWDTEIDLDVEWAHAAAPGAAITLVEAATDHLNSTQNPQVGLLAAVDYAVQVAHADVVSMSWGTGEFSTETGFDTHFPSTDATNNSNKPVMYTAAAGDSGFGTIWPAVSPAVLGVGGTRLAPSAVGNDTNQTHFGCSGMSSTPGVTSQNETVWGGGPACVQGSCPGTGGGISNIEPRPAWQNNLGLSSGGRAVPDVAMLADPFSGVALYSDGSWSSSVWGGTSLGAPLWSGVIALLNQQRIAQGLSNLNVTSSSSWAYQTTTALNDIVTGSAPSSPSDPCLSSGACTAHSGYDQVTGRGSPIGTLPWEPLQGPITSAPDAAAQGGGRLDVFARGSDNALWQRTSNGGQWGGWQSLGGVLTAAPGVVAWSPGRLDVFVRGSDNALWHRWWTTAGWSGWESLGGVLSSGPAVASWSSGRLDIFVRGSDQALWHKWWGGTAWGGWESLAGVLLPSDPGAVSWGPNRIDIVVRGSDSQMWHKSWDSVRWTPWEPLGGSLTSGLGAASPGASQLDLFGLVANGALQHKAWAGRWGAWLDLGGQWASDPGVVSQRNGTVDVFERGTDGQLWHTTIPSPLT
jgi:hypothetical protein